jgi:HEAT repeat protein
MHESSTIGTYYSDLRRNKPSLADILARHGQSNESLESKVNVKINRGVTISGEGNPSNKKVKKELAILFHFHNGEITGMTISNLTLRVDLERDPLFWLDGAEDEESISLLKNLYSSAGTSDVRENIVTAIGNHQTEKIVLPFLRVVLKEIGETNVREQAAFWMGQLNSEEALSILKDVVYHDKTEDVREQAIFAVSQMDDDRSIELLIAIARDKALPKDTRSKGMFWLGEKASQKAFKTLKDIVEDDEDSEIQRQALFALTQNDEHGADEIIRIAKTHPNKKVRREAIFWLGQSADPRALETLVDIIRK